MEDRLIPRLLLQNPWWRRPHSIDEDPQLAELAAAPISWRPEVLDELDLSSPSVYTVRGPRQVGKTTAMKVLIRRSIEEGFTPDRILYASLDLARGPDEIVDVVRTAKSVVGSRGTWRIFLDEISAVPGWQRGVKFLRDQTDARRDCFVLTGSSASDIRAGAERLPGRRGPGRRLDKVMLPMSFREYCAVTGVDLPDDRPALQDVLRARGIGPWILRADELDHALGRYCMTGGFATAVRDEVAYGQPGPAFFDRMWAVMSSDVERTGHDRLAALKLLERVVRGMGSTTSWLSASRDAGFGSPHTAEAYARLLAEAFVVLVLYAMEPGRGVALRKQKKLYVTDPVFAHLPHAIDPGAPTADTPALVENIVVLALYRALERDPAESFALPQRIGFWRSSSGREIDVLARVGRDVVPIEVKYGSRVTGKDREAIRRSFGRGLIVSRTSFDPDDTVPILPAAVFLAACTADAGPRRTGT